MILFADCIVLARGQSRKNGFLVRLKSVDHMSKLLFQCFHWLTGPLMLIATFNHVLCITALACNKYPLIMQSFSAYCNVMLQVLYFVCF